MELEQVLASWGLFILLGWAIWVIATNTRRSNVAKVQAELQSKLLDRFGSSQELLDYLGSEAGQRFLEASTIERAKPLGRILGSLQVGVILTLVALALLFLYWQFPGIGEPAVGLGILCLALGLGFLISAAVSYALLKRWGVLAPSAASMR